MEKFNPRVEVKSDAELQREYVDLLAKGIESQRNLIAVMTARIENARIMKNEKLAEELDEELIKREEELKNMESELENLQ